MKRISLVAVAVFTVLSFVACGTRETQSKAAGTDPGLPMWPVNTTSDEARQQLVDGVRELDMNRQETAYEHFKRAIAADPNLGIAEVFASFAAGQVAGLDAAYAHVARAVELSKNSGEAERLLVQSTKKSLDGDNEGALADAEQLVRVDPKGARSWDLLAFAYATVNKQAEARAARDKAIELAPNFAGEYMLQSLSYATTEPRDLVKAEEYARKAVELEPNDQGVYDVLGDALRAQGKLEEAAQAYTRCAELDPTRGDALQQRAHVQTFLGHYAEARADYDAAVALATGNNKPGLAAYRSFVSLHEGNAKAAMAELEQLYNAIDGMNVPDPVGSKQFVLNQAMIPIVVHYRMIPEAEKAFERMRQLNESQMQRIKTEEFQRTTRASMVLDEGYLAFTKGDFPIAQQKAREYMRAREADRSPTKNWGAHGLLGMVALAQKRPADAVREFEQSDPNLILFNYYQAQALDASGRKADAQKMYDKLTHYYFNPVGIGIVRHELHVKVNKTAA